MAAARFVVTEADPGLISATFDFVIRDTDDKLVVVAISGTRERADAIAGLLNFQDKLDQLAKIVTDYRKGTTP